jgi:hypothetical protein
MSIGATAFEAAYASLPDIRAQVRFARKTVVARALVAGIGGERTQTEDGMMVTPDASARMLTSDVPANGTAYGSTVEVMVPNASAWTPYRIGGRHDVAGMTRLTLEAVNAG